MVLCEGGQVRGGEVECCDHCTSGQSILVRVDHGCRLRTFGQLGPSLESLAVLLQDECIPDPVQKHTAVEAYIKLCQVQMLALLDGTPSDL